MTISIPLLVLLVIAVFVAYRHMGLRVWHAVVCLVLGFLLASTGTAPEISHLIAALVAQAQVWLSGGRA
jgi:hypothetical protein